MKMSWTTLRSHGYGIHVQDFLKEMYINSCFVPWNVNKWTGQCPNWVMTLFCMNQCDLLAPHQYIVSNLFTSDKGVEEITTRMVKW